MSRGVGEIPRGEGSGRDSPDPNSLRKVGESYALQERFS